MQILSILLSSQYDGLSKIMVGLIIGLIIGIYQIISNVAKNKKSKKTDLVEMLIEKDKINDVNEYMENPIKQIFKDLNSNQKMSIINLLVTLAEEEETSSVKLEKIKCLNSYIDILNVRQDDCTNYFRIKGALQMINDLKVLPKTQKEFLVIVGYEMLYCGGKPNLEDISLIISIFEKLDIDEDKFVEIIAKNHAIMKTFADK